MIKFTVIKATEPEITFPILARLKSTNIIVLFTYHTIGMVISSHSVVNPVGQHRNDWESVLNKTVWEILLTGEQVILENE
jgi:hypothetical protein